MFFDCSAESQEFHVGANITVSKDNTDKYTISVNKAYELNETQKLDVGLAYSEGKVIGISYDLIILDNDEGTGWSQRSFKAIDENGKGLEPAIKHDTLQFASKVLNLFRFIIL